MEEKFDAEGVVDLLDNIDEMDDVSGDEEKKCETNEEQKQGNNEPEGNSSKKSNDPKEKSKKEFKEESKEEPKNNDGKHEITVKKNLSSMESSSNIIEGELQRDANEAVSIELCIKARKLVRMKDLSKEDNPVCLTVTNIWPKGALEFLAGFNSNTNASRSLAIMGSYLKIRGQIHLAKECENHITSFDCANTLREILRHLDDTTTILNYLYFVSNPKVEITNASYDRIFEKFGTVQEYFESVKGYFHYPKLRYCSASFLSQQARNIKTVFKVSEIIPISVPKFVDLEYMRCANEWAKYPEIMACLPDRNGRKTFDREFFFNIVNTVYPNSMRLFLEQVEANRSIEEIPNKDESAPMFDDCLSVFSNLSANRKRTQKKVKTISIVRDYQVALIISSSVTLTYSYKK